MRGTATLWANCQVGRGAETMAALEAMSRPTAPNVVPMRRHG
jgi:hypothetical protein